MNYLDLLIYLDQNLTENLNSLVLNGYIQKHTSRWIEDRTLTGKAHNETHEQSFDENRCMKDKRDGYKTTTATNAATQTNWIENDQFLEGRRFVRREEEITRIYTSFELHQQLLDGLNNSNLIKDLTNPSFTGDTNLSTGDYVQITGQITSESIVSYITLFNNLLNCIDTTTISSSLKSTNSNLINIQSMQNQINCIYNLLTNNNTQDMIIKSNTSDLVVTVDTSKFFSSYANVYDKMDCNCKVIGKVVKVCEGNDCIHLLRKTGQPLFYEQMLNNPNPLKEALKSNGLTLPEIPRCKVNSKSYLIIPISLSI